MQNDVKLYKTLKFTPENLVTIQHLFHSADSEFETVINVLQ